MGDYEEIRMPEVWLIYPQRRELEVYIHDGFEFEQDRVIGTGSVQPRFFPAVVNVAALWQAFDRA
jgi:Uma2 family endonuclease